MKKTIKNIALGLLLAITTLQFSSCGHEPVFYGIIHDVVPEAATVNGNITTISRCTVNSEEYIFLSSGGPVLYKPLSSSDHGEWSSENLTLPFKLHHYNYYATSSENIGHQGEFIHRIIADASNIYILTADFEQNDQYGVVMPKSFHLWTKALDSLFDSSVAWHDIVEAHKDLFNFSLNLNDTEVDIDFSFFYTNAPQKANRKAFLCVKNQDSGDFKYYELKGSADPLDCTATATGANCIKVNAESTKVNSAFYIGSNLYFSDSLVVTTNETKDSPATYACLAGIISNYYSTSDLYIFKAGDSAATPHMNASSPIASLAITKDSLIIGKGSYDENKTSTYDGGIERVLISNNEPEKVQTDFDNNAKYQFTTSYILMALLCADPSQNEADATIYASVTYKGSSSTSSASFSNIGLWSYYPTRGNWNRE